MSNFLSHICKEDDAAVILGFSDFLVFTTKKAWIIRPNGDTFTHKQITPSTWNWNSEIMNYLTCRNDNKYLRPNAAAKINKFFEFIKIGEERGRVTPIESLYDLLNN